MKKLIIITITLMLLASTAYAVEKNRLQINLGSMVLQIISLQEQNEQVNENLSVAYDFILKQLEKKVITKEDLKDIKDPNFIKLLQSR